MKKLILVVFFILFLLLVAACAPVCSADQLTAAFDLTPGNGTAVTVANPGLDWQYGRTCEVENFHFEVSADPLMNDPALTGDTLDHYLGFSTAIEYLDEDCTTYYFRVTAEADGASVASPVAHFRTDFAGTCPVLGACTEAPAAPIARVPYGGQKVTDPQQQLIWEDGDADCAVDQYNVEVATTPTFASLWFAGTSPYPWLQFVPASPYLEDCSTFFWRVIAQSPAGNTPSNIIQFWTDFEGTCPKIPMCSADQLETPDLLSPIGGEVIDNANPPLIYYFNTPDCAPEASEFWVSADPDFGTYAIHGNADYITASYPDSSIFQAGMDYLDDCTTYYWKIQVTVGATTLTSPVETFETNFTDTCSFAAPDLAPSFADLFHLKSFNLGCIDPTTMFATFVFEEPILGSYEAHLGRLRTWPCALLQGHDNGLICSGQAVSQGVDVQVDLFSLDTQEVVLSQTGFSELCEVATQAPRETCQPPAGGCSQSCPWCQLTCECRCTTCP